MKIAAVIAEYNPFHNGHAYQLAQIKKQGYDYIVIIMSGNFMQRGTPAIVDKYARTRMALQNGADLVLELPVCYAAGSAEYFATGAVSILKNLHCVHTLFFGSESGDISLLKKAAALLADETEDFRKTLDEALRRGDGYASARLQALSASGAFTAEELDTLSRSNDILGVEYLRALHRLYASPEHITVPGTMEAEAIKRIGSGYHDMHFSNGIASAEALRNLLFTDSAAEISDLVPESTVSYFADKNAARDFLSMDDFSALLQYQLLLNESRLETFHDSNEDIANRIRSQLYTFDTASNFLMQLKTKELTYTRLNRVLTHILLNITTEEMNAFTVNEYLGYARILGFTKRAEGTLLKTVKDNATIPLVAKPADFKPSGDLKTLFEKDLLASHIYESVRSRKSGSPFTHELRHSPLIL